MLAGRRIVLGISGGVAAYKAAYLARLLVERGARVKPVMTQSAVEFLGPQTLAAITGEQPVVGLFGLDDVSPHTHLAQWADAIVIVPATAATLSRLANGLTEDALSATVLAAQCPVVAAPAMHTEMWEHPATTANVKRLEEFGYVLVSPEYGALAGGDEGVGRMAEPDTIVDLVDEILGGSGAMEGVRVLVNAGGTREAIDPVRYIGNRSSGKMGNAIAVSAANSGASVVLVTAAKPPDHPTIEVVAVESAQEMADAVWVRAGNVDVAVLAAAVADFRPVSSGDAKLRRAAGPPEIELEPTPDVLAGVANLVDRPFLVGFAAETGSLDEAVAKGQRKGVDLLVANDVARVGSGFGSQTNEVTIVFPDGHTTPWELADKTDIADRLWSLIGELMRDGDAR